MNLLKVLDTGRVERYHCAPVRDKQCLDAHHWEVAIILEYIYPQCTKQLLLYALTHDCGEAYAGDMSGLVKLQYPALKKMLDKIEHSFVTVDLELNHINFTDTMRLAVKWADGFSGLYYVNRQLKAGDSEVLTKMLFVSC